MKKFTTLQIEEIHPTILLVTLHRPEVRNAINSVMMQELHEFWQTIKKNTDLRCIILTGTAPAFCAGADLKERRNLTLEVWQTQRVRLEQAMLDMIACPIPVIAAVNGPAYGGGLELALSSDFIYAATTARFAQSEVKLGLMPGALGTQQLPRACGIKRAKELAFTGNSFSAEEAREWGIVNKIVDPENLLAETLITAKVIAENAPLAVHYTKKSLDVAHDLDLKSGYAYELEAYNKLLLTKDREEGIRAFNEKRKAEFRGE